MSEGKSCKFRCRTNREAFMAGWHAFHEWSLRWYEDDPPREEENRLRAYREWRKANNEVSE